MNALYLSVSTGSGHIKAAQAIKEAAEVYYPCSRHLLVDSLKYINPVVDKLVVGGYLNTIRTSPQIYGKLFRFSEVSDNIYHFSKAINNFFSFKVKGLIESFEPSIIVCTHPFSIQMISTLKKREASDIPVIAVLTDFIIHSFWIDGNIDAYIVANDSMRNEMILRGIAPDRVFSYGIPVSDNFTIKKDRTFLLKDLGLSNRTTILIMGGSLGLGEITGAFLALLKSHMDIQIIVITGENAKVKKGLEELAAHSDKPVKILSYTDRVADYMDVSNLIITKPGGMTTAEALVKQVPIVLISPIPGQEEGNSSFLCREGAAVRINRINDISNIVQQLLSNPLQISLMKTAAMRLARPNAGRDTAALIETLIKHR